MANEYQHDHGSRAPTPEPLRRCRSLFVPSFLIGLSTENTKKYKGDLRELKVHIREHRAPTSTGTKRAVYAGVVPAVVSEMGDMVEAMHNKHREGDANNDEEGVEREEDNGESDVNDDLDGFEVLGKVIVIVGVCRSRSA
jgi:hypothetical protein